jgi:hypothetical protein
LGEHLVAVGRLGSTTAAQRRRLDVMTAYYEERLARAKLSVAECEAALESGLHAVPEHTASGIPTDPPRAVTRLERELEAAKARLEEVRAQGNDPS